MARTKKIRTVRKAHAVRTPDANARHLWLAGLGLVVLARRQSQVAAQDLVRRAIDMRRQAVDTVADARASLADTASALRSQVQIGAGQAVEKIETVVAPLVARFGGAKTGRNTRRTRQPAAKKGVRRGAAARQIRKPVRRSRKA